MIDLQGFLVYGAQKGAQLLEFLLSNAIIESGQYIYHQRVYHFYFVSSSICLINSLALS